MDLNTGIPPNMANLELSNVMEVVSSEKDPHEICASDILQQALEEASQTLGPSVDDCEDIKISDGEICIEPSDVGTHDKLVDISETNSRSQLNVTFNENGSCNLISIPDSMNLENFTVPVFTAESGDAVALTLGNLPITAISDTITLSISNNTVTFPCTLEADSNGILTSTSILNPTNSDSSQHKNTLLSENASDLLESIVSQDSLSNHSKSSQMFQTDIVSLESAVDQPIDSLNGTAEDSLSGLELPPPNDTGAPIGSSENPIQIVQHGTTYHSTQMLNQEQLAQIAQVLQQQQVSKSTEKGRSAVLYNPTTNTRIVYRVVYPSGVHAKIGESSQEGSAARSNLQPSKGSRGRSRKAWTRRPCDDERKVDGPDLSREEKEMKKKHRPRTRSGRISKPPSYMIKDYKRIHHLDFNEDPQNDSDGGYSDFHLSEEEAQQGEERDHTNALPPPGVSTIKPRNYKCSTCDKAYIGRGGLGRHFRLNPGHGTLTPEEGDDLNDPGLSDENSNASLASENSQPLPSSEPLLTEMPPIVVPTPPQEEASEDPEIRVLPVKNIPPQKPKENQLAPIAKRKAKLKELIQPFGDADLIEAVMPRLSQAITLWEFLLLKSEKGDPSLPHVPDIFRHFEDLLSRLQLLAQDCLILTSSSASAVTNVALSSGSSSPPITSLMTDENKVYVEITNERVGQVLGVSTGLYEVLQWKLLEHVPSLLSRTAPQNNSGIGKRPGPQKGFLGTPNRKRLKKDLLSKEPSPSLILSEPELPLDQSNMAAFRVDENSIPDSHPSPNVSCKRDKLETPASLLRSDQTIERFSAITSQSQDSNFSLDTTCQVTSAEDLLSVNNRGSLSQSLTFSSAGGTMSGSDLPSHSFSKNSNINLSVLPKVSAFGKGQSLLGILPTDDKCGNSNAKQTQTMPSLQVRKVNIFSKAGSFLSIAGNDVNSDGSLEKHSARLDLSNSDRGFMFLKEGDTLLTQTSTVQPHADIATSLASHVGNNAAFISLLNDTPMMLDVPVSLASLNTTPNTVMTSVSSLMNVPSLDALLSQSELSQFRMSEESSALRDALTQAMDQTKEMDCPSNILPSSSSDEIPVIQLVVPEVSSGILNSPSSTSNQYETIEGHEHVTTSLLPGNVVIVQNEDGTTTLQLPTDQPFSLETLQAFFNMDQTFTAEILKDGLNGSDNKQVI